MQANRCVWPCSRCRRRSHLIWAVLWHAAPRCLLQRDPHWCKQQPGPTRSWRNAIANSNDSSETINYCNAILYISYFQIGLTNVFHIYAFWPICAVAGSSCSSSSSSVVVAAAAATVVVVVDSVPIHNRTTFSGIVRQSTHSTRYRSIQQILN